MSIINSFILPSDRGCIALINPQKYTSFVDENWHIENKLISHLLTAINRNSAIAWGCPYGNLNIEIRDDISDILGYRSFCRTIASNGKLILVNYDSLTYAAQFDDVCLPLSGMEDFQLVIVSGRYLCRIIQLFDPRKAESKQVFDRDSPHFRIELKKDETILESCQEIPWL